jgi:hypothetical protein
MTGPFTFEKACGGHGGLRDHIKIWVYIPIEP